MPVWRRQVLPSTDSTNEEVRRQAEAGAPEGLVVRADIQLAGRGRRGRPWQSPEGNLYVSLLLRPDRTAAEAATLSFLSALALHEAVEMVAGASGIILGQRLRCKWPNDLLLDGAKLSGILLESRTGPTGRLEHVIPGIGVNLTSHPPDMPYAVTSLAAQGLAVLPDDFLGNLLERFGFWYDLWLASGFAPVRAAWLEKAEGVGKPVVVRRSEGDLAGRFVALDDGGALILELPGGRRQAITAGDVFPAV